MLSNAKKEKMLLIGIAIMLVMVPVLAGAVEVTFPVPAYTQEELAKVREWEKAWAGKKVDKTNIDQVAEFMLESYAGIYKNPEKWGAPPEGLYFYVVPYAQIIETTGMIEATRKYAPLVKTDAEGKIINYTEIAGFPFPNPKTGLELAYNTECQTRGDTNDTRWRGAVIDPKSRTDRIADQEFTEMFFTHRVDVAPKPVIPKNTKGYAKGEFVHIYLPAEFNNTRMISMKFIDETKDYDSYIYFSPYRRLQRLSTSERTNAVDGTDQFYDDGNMFDGYLQRNTFAFKGKKELLLARHQDMAKTTRIQGQAIPNGLTYERCNTYVVEMKSKDPHYVYSKRVWYIDPETYTISWQEVYDELGRYWKGFLQPTNNFKNANGEMKNIKASFNYHDFQRNHSNNTAITVKGVSIPVDPKIFLLGNLQKTY
jgi:hypothetical protein